MKLAIRIIGDWNSCELQEINSKSAEIYLITKDNILLDKIEKINNTFNTIFNEDRFLFVQELPEDIIEKLEVSDKEKIIKFPWYFKYNIVTKSLENPDEIIKLIDSLFDEFSK